MADSNLPPRYVGYRRPNLPPVELSHLVLLIRCSYLNLGLAGFMTVLSILYFAGFDVASLAYKVIVSALLLFYGVMIYQAGRKLTLTRWLFALSLAGVVSAVATVLLIGVPHSGALPLLAEATFSGWGLASSVAIRKQLTQYGFKSWPELKAEMERQNHVPPIPANLHSGEPPRLP